MANIRRFLGFSSFIVLTSCLPATEPVDNDSACSSSWKTYDSSWWAWDPEDHSTTAVLTTEVLDPEFDYNVPYTTLCDGYRRAVVSRTTTPTITYDPPTTITAMQYYPEPEPTCTIGEAACTKIFSSYTSASSVWVAEGNGVGSLSPREPRCTTYRPCDSPEWPGDMYCYIHVGYQMKLFYWEVTTTAGDFCTSSGSTVLALPTNPPFPNTFVTEGHTFTSPTNYLSFAVLSAALNTRRNKKTPVCGTKVYSNVVLPITGALTTQGLDGNMHEVNFEAYNTMKYEDFKAQRWCRNNACTVIEGFYTPVLALPTEVLDLDPVEWKAAGCMAAGGVQPRMVPLVTPAPVAKEKLL